MVFEVEVGGNFLNIGGRFDVVECDFATARKANITSDCTINAVDGKISGPERYLYTLVPTKKQTFLAYLVEFMSSMCTLGGKIRPSRVILKGSMNSFGGMEVVDTGVVVLVAVTDRAAD